MHLRLYWSLLLMGWAALASAAEHKFNFGEVGEGKLPPGFTSTVTGQGGPGDWRIVLDEVPPAFAPLSPQARTDTKRAVLAQVAQDKTDEHFPLLIYEGDTYADFTFSSRFKTVSGVLERMAGLAFRIQNPSNYYVVRASSLGNTFRFYKVENGARGPVVGPEMPIPSGVWHELTVQCKGNNIRCLLDGHELINRTDKINAFMNGKIGFWTKSDSVSYFTDAKVVYTPFEPPAQALVRALLKKYPRLRALKIYVPGKVPKTTTIVASQDEKELGRPGSNTELEVIGRGETYYGKEKDQVSVIMPLRDRNGEVIAAARVVMKSFRGQTEENAIIRAGPIVKEIQAQVNEPADLAE